MKQSRPQYTVTEAVVCENCRAVGQWRSYHKRGNTRYYRCVCGHRRVDREVVKMRGLRPAG